MGATGIACFSFYWSANLPIGQGGMVTTGNSQVVERVRKSRTRGAIQLAWRPHVNGYPQSHGLRDGGLDASLTDLSAAIGRSQLTHLGSWQQRRDRLAERYDDRLADIPGVALPHRPSSGTGQHAWHHYPLRIEHPTVQRDAVDRALSEAGIGTAQRLVPLHRVGYVRDLFEAPIDDLPGADRFAEQTVSLPVHPRVPEDAADPVADVLGRILDGHPEVPQGLN